MCRKYFSKNKGVLSRRFVASGLTVVFSAGMFGSYAGAMGKIINEDFKINLQNIANIVISSEDKSVAENM